MTSQNHPPARHSTPHPENLLQRATQPKGLNSANLLQGATQPKGLNSANLLQGATQPKGLNSANLLQGAIQPKGLNSANLLQGAIQPKGLKYPASEHLEAQRLPFQHSQSKHSQKHQEHEKHQGYQEYQGQESRHRNTKPSPSNTTKTALGPAGMTPQAKRQKLLKEPEYLGHLLGYRDLTALHGTWIKTIWSPNLSEDTLILAHRNSYKTTAIVIVGVIWYLLFRPNHTILLARKEYKGAAATLARIRNHYLEPKVAALYVELGITGQFRLAVAKENTLSLSTKTTITQEGNIEVIGTSAKGITGRHYDRIHLDDVVTEHDRDSAKERLKTIRFYENLKSVIKPGNIITATGTPWHKYDLYKSFPNIHRYPVGTVPIKAFTAEQIKRKRKELPPVFFASQYLLKHIHSQHNLFTTIKRSATWNPDAATLGHIDPAFGGSHTSALSIVQFSQQAIIVIGHIFEGHIREHYPTILNLIKKYNLLGTYIETNADKGAMLYDLQQHKIVAWGYHENTHKHVKIMTILYQYWNHIYFHRDCAAEYIAQIEDYNEHAKLDDAPDSLASLLVRCGRNFTPTPVTDPSAKGSHSQVYNPPVPRLSWVDSIERGVDF